MLSAGSGTPCGLACMDLIVHDVLRNEEPNAGSMQAMAICIGQQLRLGVKGSSVGHVALLWPKKVSLCPRLSGWIGLCLLHLLQGWSGAEHSSIAATP